MCGSFLLPSRYLTAPPCVPRHIVSQSSTEAKQEGTPREEEEEAQLGCYPSLRQQLQTADLLQLF